VTVHEQPFPVTHFYSILDVNSNASVAQQGSRCCPTARATNYRETNFIIILIVVIIVITTKLEKAKPYYGMYNYI